MPAQWRGVPGVLAVVWADNGSPPVVLFTIGASGLPALTAVLARYVAANPADAAGTRWARPSPHSHLR